jgi:3D (Asp-Asp-Asp) domain-containing protein
VGIAKHQPLLASHRIPNPLEIDSAVRALFREFQDVSAFLQKIEEWVGSFYNRAVALEDFSNTDSGIANLELTPVVSRTQSGDRNFCFRLQGSDQLVFKLKIIFENDRLLERCLLAKEDHLKKELFLIEVLPVPRVLATPNGLYLCRVSKTMEATAYYPGPECTGNSCDGLTSTGKKAGYGIVAVDPEVIPLGTKLYIQGYGFAEAADVGGAIKGMRIDLCFNTYREAILFGRKKVKVFILD